MDKLLEYDPAWGELLPPPIDHLSEDEKIAYWRSTTSKQRLREVQRLRRLEWGPAADGPMDKSKIEVVDMKTGEVIETIYNTKMVNN